LVANAPHVPVHLGSMQHAVKYQHELNLGKLKPGDVLLSNSPSTSSPKLLHFLPTLSTRHSLTSAL
jgi:5-oxoprolinase (ATP-hydrolysing)